MEKELAKYAETKMSTIANQQQNRDSADELTVADDESLVSLEDRFSTFDATAAQESLYFIGEVFRGMGEEITQRSTVSYDAVRGELLSSRNTP